MSFSQEFVEKLQDFVHFVAKKEFESHYKHYQGDLLKNLITTRVCSELDIAFPEVKYVVECDVMVEPLCDRRDNRIDHILNNTELKRETELLLSVKYLYGYDVRRLAIHLEEPRNNVLDITL